MSKQKPAPLTPEPPTPAEQIALFVRAVGTRLEQARKEHGAAHRQLIAEVSTNPAGAAQWYMEPTITAQAELTQFQAVQAWLAANPDATLAAVQQWVRTYLDQRTDEILRGFYAHPTSSAFANASTAAEEKGVRHFIRGMRDLLRILDEA